jgi:hypothetical protein
MDKPKGECMIKLSEADVKAAIQLYLNEGKFCRNITVLSVKKTRSPKYMITAEIK